MSATDTAALLEKIGFKAASDKVKRLAERKRKLAVASEHYKFVRQEKIEAFNAKLKKETMKGKEPYSASWKQLSFTPIAQYPEIPPHDVLLKVEEAVERKCFDSFEVAHIVDVKDPIVFGRIENCTVRFFIAQWDDDCRIEDILAPNEG